jgi:histidine ammonia-lyase
VASALGAVRARVAPMTGDRPLYLDIEAVNQLVASHDLVSTVEKAVGALR